MNTKSIAGGAVLSLLGLTALAHNGATGITLERMNSMVALRTAMAELAPMMQGQTAFDARAVEVKSATILAHAGDNMNKLFPQEPLSDKSFAKPEIWQDWEKFTSLSEELRTYALGLTTAAANGLTQPTSAPTMADHASMIGNTAMQMDKAKSGFTVSELMGVTKPNGTMVPISATVSGEAAADIDFAMMSAPQVFELVSGVCSSCHSQFRSGN
jgi:cytochrome c556